MSLLFLTVMFQSESCMTHCLSGQISFQKCQKWYLLKTQLSSKHTKVIVDLTLWPITGVQYDVTVLAQSDWWNEGFLRHRPLWTFKVVLKWRAYRSVNFCHRKNSKPPLKRTQKTGFNKGAFKNYVDQRGWVGGSPNVNSSNKPYLVKASTRGR